MINILIPLGGKSDFFNSSEYQYPKSLIEIQGKTMIQRVIENYAEIEHKKFIFVVNQTDCDIYHLDSILKLLTNGNCEIVRLNGATRGGACSALLAIDQINTETPLIIANSDQVLEVDLANICQCFRDQMIDAGVVTFESIHPKWSFIRIDEGGSVIEAAEKRPISKNAIAGFYYFGAGKNFVIAAMESIKKDAHVNELFYIAPVLNELVLRGCSVGYKYIEATSYHSFYSPAKIAEYEGWLAQPRSGS